MLARIRKSLEVSGENKERGFTLIELLVVMIIIGILAAIAVPTFMNQRKNGYRTAVKSDLRNAMTAIESWAVDNGGGYTGLTTTKLNDPNVVGFQASYNTTSATGVVVIVAATPAVDATTYFLEATHTSLGTPEKGAVKGAATGGYSDPTKAACA